MPSDIDILTITGIKKITLSEKGEKIISNYTPVVDPNEYYIKTVTSD